MTQAAFDMGVAAGIKLAAIDVRNFRILPTADSREEEIEKAVKGHKDRADGSYGAETARTGARYGAGGAALGTGLGAGYGAAIGAGIRNRAGKGRTGKGALIGAGIGAAAGAGLGAIGGLFKGHGRTQMAKKLEKMSPADRKAYLRDQAMETRHNEALSAAYSR